LSEADQIDDAIDSHCHLDFGSFDKDREEVIARARASGVRTILNSGVDHNTNQKTLELARQHAFIYPTLGLSPNYVGKMSKNDLEELLDQIRQHSREIKGVGEVGLDYYRCTDPDTRMKQVESFRQVIDLAVELNLPLVIHSRQAEQEAFEMVRSLERVVFHCFGGRLETMRAIVERGFYVSLATNACYSNHHRTLARQIPLDSLLIETDSPFLSPRRGRNEPSYVLDLVREIARIKEVSPVQVAEVTARNTERIFGL
jgi:TatD DNase family protein